MSDAPERTEDRLAALATIPDHLDAIEAALAEAPYRRAKPAIERIEKIRDILARATGREHVGACDECSAGITTADEHIAADDGRVWCVPCARDLGIPMEGAAP
ncbi:MAG: hypothetical protein EBZ50_16115 [Alphaproteobacteria bacterium]|nr:hypothetical protein [Alphaproteobacteria bacterium]